MAVWVALPTDVLGQVMMQLLARNDLASATVDQVVGGCINKLAAQGMNVTRTAWLAHGGAIETPCITIDSQCGSSQQSVSHSASRVWLCGCRYGLRRGKHDATTRRQRCRWSRQAHERGYRSYFEQHEFTSQFEGAGSSLKSTN